MPGIFYGVVKRLETGSETEVESVRLHRLEYITSAQKPGIARQWMGLLATV